MSNPSTVWNQLQTGNRFFRSTLRTTGKHPAKKQSPSAVVFRCADADTASEAVFGQAWGSLVDASNWGHVIDSGVLATVEYAVGTLHIPLIVVLGHEHCTAMKTAWSPGITSASPRERLEPSSSRRCRHWPDKTRRSARSTSWPKLM